jgi:hypothetical protein
MKKKNPLEETFGILTLKRSTEEILREVDEEGWDEDDLELTPKKTFEEIAEPIRKRVSKSSLTRNGVEKAISEYRKEKIRQKTK